MRLSISWMLVAVTYAAVLFAILHWWRIEREYLLWCLDKSDGYAEVLSGRCDRTGMELMEMQARIDRLERELRALKTSHDRSPAPPNSDPSE